MTDADQDAAAKTLLQGMDLPPGLDPVLAAKTLAAWSGTLRETPTLTDPNVTLKSRVGAPGDPAIPAGVARPNLAASSDYSIKRELGRGGMGVVYEAEQKTFGREVAMKMLLPDLARTPELEARFVSEARVTGRLEHPNIVPVYDLGRTSDERVYLGMKLVRGESLKAFLEREPAATHDKLRRPLEILAAISDALAFAHARGVIHRDLKPENVMLGEFGEVQVMDWGLALDVTPEGAARRAGESGLAGTPAYMSPEQAGGDVMALGTWSDVYLLGALLYDILAGVPPHRGTTVLDTILVALKGQVVPPSVRTPTRGTPRELEALCMEALALDPKKRPASARAFKERIQSYVAHSEALRFIERTRALLDSREGTIPEQAERLAQARVVLDQARELWPDSEEVKSLANELVARQADVALERGDGGAARVLAAALVPDRGVPAARIDELRRAASRQERRWRNQVLVAAVLLVATCGILAWVDGGRAERERAARIQGARTELRLATGDAWDALRHERDLGEVERLIEKVVATANDAGWSEEWDRLLPVAAAWRALRLGDEGRAVALLPPGWRGPLRRSVDDAQRSGDALAAADAWLARAKVAKASPGVERLGEALVLCAGARAAPSARLERDTAVIAARLAATGARAVLADARSSVPPALLVGLTRPGEAGVRWAMHTTAAVSSRTRDALIEPRRFVVALDARDGHELWRFPPASHVAIDEDVSSPFLVRHEGAPLLLVSWGADLVGLDPASGVVKTRLRTHDRVSALLPVSDTELEVVHRGRWGRSRSRTVRATATRALQPLAPGKELVSRLVARGSARALLALPPSPPPPTEVAGVLLPALELARAAHELARLPDARRRDPTNPYVDYHEALRELALGRTAAAAAALERFSKGDLSPWELALVADGVDELGAFESADRLADRAVAASVAGGANPDLSPFAVGNAAVHLRRIARRASQRGDDARRARLEARSREVATVLEGDFANVPVEKRWLAARGETRELEALAPYEGRAQSMGGIYMTPPALVEAVDPALLLFLSVPFVLGGAALVIGLRVRAAQTADLRALGFRSWASRQLAFFTNPVLRISHTSVAYATRTERLVLVVGSLLLIVSVSHLGAVVTAIGEIAAFPVEVGSGHMDHPSALELVLGMKDRVAPEESASHRRLIAEGLLLRGDADEAQRALDEVLAVAPGDAFALNNSALLLERKGDRAGALALYRRAGAVDGDAGAIGRANVARLEGAARPALPVAYAALRRVDPALERPIRQFADPEDLLGTLDLLRSPWRSSMKQLLSARGSVGPAFSAALGVSAAEGLLAQSAPLEWFVAFVLPGLAVFFLLHVPFAVRKETAPAGPRTERALATIGSLLDVALPGSYLVARRRILLGVVVMLAAPFLLLTAHMAKNGPLLMAFGFASLAPLAPVATEDAGQALASDLLRTIGPEAEVAAYALYGVTWLLALVRLARWMRARWTRAA